MNYFELTFCVNITRLSKGNIACSLGKNSAPVLLYSRSESIDRFQTESVVVTFKLNCINWVLLYYWLKKSQSAFRHNTDVKSFVKALFMHG